MYYLDTTGHCPICEKDVRFTSEYSWLRDHLLCAGCGSIPRERALMHVIDIYFPEYRKLKIHESSPVDRGVSSKLKNECSHYSYSHYFPNCKPGMIHHHYNCQCQNLENLTFNDGTFDLFITQDVMEHILNPSKAFREISRVLKTNGAHIFTVPLVRKAKQSECLASLNDKGEILHHSNPEYHGNPINQEGSLVTMAWGYDLAEFIQLEANTPTTIVMIDNLNLGIRAEYIEVLISRKYK